MSRQEDKDSIVIGSRNEIQESRRHSLPLHHLQLKLCFALVSHHASKVVEKFVAIQISACADQVIFIDADVVQGVCFEGWVILECASGPDSATVAWSTTETTVFSLMGWEQVPIFKELFHDRAVPSYAHKIYVVKITLSQPPGDGEVCGVDEWERWVRGREGGCLCVLVVLVGGGTEAWWG